GIAALEFALVLPALLFLLVGLTEVGSGLNAYLTVINAGRDAARLGANGNVPDDIIRDAAAFVMDRLPNAVNPATDITVEHNAIVNREAVKVTVCYDHKLILGPSTAFLDISPFRMCASSTMPVLTANPGAPA
ncbi:MAG: TadE/TadG family type IV pilus assembly protein, partial [Myxococcota bacterium]